MIVNNQLAKIKLLEFAKNHISQCINLEWHTNANDLSYYYINSQKYLAQKLPFMMARVIDIVKALEFLDMKSIKNLQCGEIIILFKDNLIKENNILVKLVITKERLIRASKKIQKENTEKDLSTQDLGFKIFETMPIWEDYNFEADELDAQQMLLFDESKLTKEDIRALLVAWKTYDGASLSQSLQEIDLTGYVANYSNGKFQAVLFSFQVKQR